MAMLGMMGAVARSKVGGAGRRTTRAEVVSARKGGAVAALAAAPGRVNGLAIGSRLAATGGWVGTMSGITWPDDPLRAIKVSGPVDRIDGDPG